MTETDNAASAATERASGQSQKESKAAGVAQWILRKASAVSPEVAQQAGQSFLDTQSARRPDFVDHYDLAQNEKYASSILREVSLKLPSSAPTSLRDEIAEKRVQASLISSEPTVSREQARDYIEKLRAISPVYQRRLAEGRVEEEDLVLLLKKVRQPKPDAAALALANKPHVWSAGEIVAEYAKRNQEGAAAQKIEAYTVHAKLRPAKGEEQSVILVRMRPNRMRMFVGSAGKTDLILSWDGEKFWQQLPNGRVMELTAEQIGTRKYLTEFINPLLEPDGFRFERADDGKEKTYRLSVVRPDGSKYVSNIDQENFQETSHEDENGLKVSYSDFRDVVGVKLPFREDLHDSQGNTSTLQIERIEVNPGVVRSLFKPVELLQPDFFSLEHAIAEATSASVKAGGATK